jgi:predicted nucleic acid-binding protein
MPVIKPKVYIETTIPSFYHSTRTDPVMVARRKFTREWWDNWREGFEVVTSDAVKDELEQGDHPEKAAKLALLSGLPLLSITAAVVEIEEVYIARTLMPRDPFGDAMHLALASYYKCDYLLTWNCAHLANPKKAAHLHRINGILGLFTPALVTPETMVEGEVRA